MCCHLLVITRMQIILKSFKYGPGELVFIFLQHSKFQRFVCTMTIIFHVGQYAVITVNLKKCVPKQQVTKYNILSLLWR